jgi:flagellar hook-basal body complex protein FliE
MTIGRIPVQPAEIGLLPEIPPATSAPKADGKKFENVLEGFLNDVDGLQKRSEELQKGALEGTVQDIHEVMIAAEEAGIAFELMVELRNKLLEAYRELMRMQI